MIPEEVLVLVTKEKQQTSVKAKPVRFRGLL